MKNNHFKAILFTSMQILSICEKLTWIRLTDYRLKDWQFSPPVFKRENVHNGAIIFTLNAIYLQIEMQCILNLS